MDGHDSHRLSVSVRNALSVNNVKTQELFRTVRSLEAKRDHELLTLQVKKGEVISSVPGINKPVSKLSNVTSDSRSSTPHLVDHGSSALLNSINRESLIRAHSLPPLHKQASVLGTPPRVRRAATLQQEQTHPAPAPPSSPRSRRVGIIQSANSLSPPCTPNQTLNSSQTSRKFFSRQLSSPGLVPASSLNSLRDLSHEETLECQHRFSPRGRSSIVPASLSNITAGPFKCSTAISEQGKGNEQSIRPRTASEAEGGVHRGLTLRPISSSVAGQKKPKEKLKTAVFSRLYKNVRKEGEGLTAMRRISSAQGKQLNGRRRSISMPDLSEMMENLKACRYLRGADAEVENGAETMPDAVETQKTTEPNTDKS